jgi:hypothetical protein
MNHYFHRYWCWFLRRPVEIDRSIYGCENDECMCGGGGQMSAEIVLRLVQEADINYASYVALCRCTNTAAQMKNFFIIGQ